jgi:Spy/CpxP family protein refolding chaperone
LSVRSEKFEEAKGEKTFRPRWLPIHTAHRSAVFFFTIYSMGVRMTYKVVPNVVKVFMAMLLFQCVVAAQPQHRQKTPQGGPMPPGDVVTQLQKSLKLTDDQTAKINTIFDAQRETMEQLRDSADAQREAIHEKMEQNRKATEEKISSILTDEQKQKFVKIQKRQLRHPMPDEDNGPSMRPRPMPDQDNEHSRKPMPPPEEEDEQ